MGKTKGWVVVLCVGAGILVIVGIVAASIVVGKALRDTRDGTGSVRPRPAPPTRANAPLPEALSSGGTSTPVVTPEQARAVTAAFWPLREQALAADNIPMTDLIETGVARELDNAISTDDLETAQPSVRKVRQPQAIEVSMTEQGALPAQFLARVLTTSYADSSPWLEILLFTRDGPKSHWRLAFETGNGVGVLANFEDHFEPPPSFAAPPALVVGQMSSYWQACENTGAPPPLTQFLPGPWTTQLCSTIAQEPQDTISPNCRCLRHLEYSVDSKDAVYEISPNTVCGTVRVDETFRPASSDGRLYQNGSRRNWGGWLDPGYYRTILTRSIKNFCATVPAASSGWDVLSRTGENVLVTGTR